MSDVFDTVLLTALPASGKSETRNLLTHRSPESFHMGPTVQIDDYPYIHLQLRVDEILEELGHPRVYHHTDPAGGRNGPFFTPKEFGAFAYLISEDFHEILTGEAENPESAADRLFERLDAASVAAGAPSKFDQLAPDVLAKLKERIEPEAREMFDEKAKVCPASREGKTVVIEFARGGPDEATMPLSGGYGYIGTLPHFSPELLERAVILYVWVTPAESRRKNRERARPGEDGSILFHGVPEVVMYKSYGSCDMEHLIETSEAPNTVTVETTAGPKVLVPVARVDNREDLTTFLRGDPDEWSDEDVAKIKVELTQACNVLWETSQGLKR